MSQRLWTVMLRSVLKKQIPFAQSRSSAREGPRIQKRFPVRGKRAKSGSNVRDRKSSAALPAQLLEERKARERLRQEWQARTRRLFTTAEKRRAAEIVASARHELHASNLALGSDPSLWEANKDRLRKRLDRDLARALPRYREFQAITRAHGRAVQAVSRNRRARIATSGVHVSLGSVLPPDAGTAQIFSPPYAVYEQRQLGIGVDATDRSFVVPGIGHLINDFTCSHDDDGPLITDLLGLMWWGELRVVAGCGVNYTTPTAGRLRILGALQNFYNKLNFSVEDLFGFSEAELDIHVELFVQLVRASKRTFYFTRLLHGGHKSFGSDLAYQMPQLDTTLPYTIEVTTEESYSANTGLQVIVGAGVHFYSDINDMRTHANGLLWWQVKRLTVDVV